MSPRISTLLVGAFLTAVVLAPAASAQDPPPAEPDLGAMAIGAQDLPHGATVIGEGSTSYPGAESAYDRTFALGVGAARTAGFVSLDSTVALYADVPTATSMYRTLRKGFGSRHGRRMLARLIARGAGVAVRRVKVGSAREVHVGDEAVEIPITVRFHGLKLREVLALARVDRVIAQMSTDGIGSRAALMRRTKAMLDTNTQHIRAGLQG